MSNYPSTGWQNRETWNMNNTYAEIFDNLCEEQDYDDIDHVADSFRALVEELELGGLKNGTLAQQVVAEYLARVDWQELAEHYAYDHNLFIESVEEEEDDTELE